MVQKKLLGSYKIAYCDKIKECGYSLNQGTKWILSNFVVNNEGSKKYFCYSNGSNLYKARNMYLVRSRHYDVGKALGFGNGGWNGSAATIEAMLALGTGNCNPDPRLELTLYRRVVCKRARSY